ncbi:hypothetical protein D0Z07_6870 [Hyphodiscus hymeniophilus]|uniref:AB hydrolase-1 domain-containing protein n=1 Tax=Hyphodiscus hymeniophilus TaxID=353542 RepID=A0A9P7AVS7_9HELO|nr:hypothetical protein D0Z07_6870 [Hyphodiscus hymeniophilus]
MSHKPTLILVPGAWHGPNTWDKVTALLEAQQYKCITVDLPSANSDPSATLLDDVNAVRGPIVTETEQGRDVVVVVHSYGGFVGPSAIKGLTRPKDGSSSKTQSGHVIGLAYISSGFAPTGVAFLEALGGNHRRSGRSMSRVGSPS